MAGDAFVRVMQYDGSDIKILVGSGALTVRDARLPTVQPTVLRVGRVEDNRLWKALKERLHAPGMPLVRRPWPAQQRMVRNGLHGLTCKLTHTQPC